MNEILFKDEYFLIQGAIFEVYREMGCGFLEAVYQECLEECVSTLNAGLSSGIDCKVLLQELKGAFRRVQIDEGHQMGLVFHNT